MSSSKRKLPRYYIEMQDTYLLKEVTEKSYEELVKECKEKRVPYVVNRRYYESVGEVTRILSVDLLSIERRDVYEY